MGLSIESEKTTFLYAWIPYYAFIVAQTYRKLIEKKRGRPFRDGFTVKDDYASSNKKPKETKYRRKRISARALRKAKRNLKSVPRPKDFPKKRRSRRLVGRKIKKSNNQEPTTTTTTTTCLNQENSFNWQTPGLKLYADYLKTPYHDMTDRTEIKTKKEKQGFLSKLQFWKKPKSGEGVAGIDSQKKSKEKKSQGWRSFCCF